MIAASTAAPYATASSGLMLVGFLSIEEFGHQFDNAVNAGRTADKDNLVNVGIVDLRVPKHLFDGPQSAAE